MSTEEFHEQLVRDLPRPVRLAREALQNVGLLPAKTSRELGGFAWIECRPQADSRDPTDYRQMASRAVRKAGLNIPLETITISQVAGQIIVRIPVRIANERASERFVEKLSFKKFGGDSLVAIRPYTPVALLNTYNDFAETLKEIRTVVVSNRAISAEELRRKFARSRLAKATNHTRWEEWRRSFASKELTAKNAALILLEDTTSLQRSSLKTMLSKGRSRPRLS